MKIDKMKMQTRDGVADNIMWIAEKFPNCITEKIDAASGEVKLAVDFDMLRQELSSEVVEDKDERYQFVWPDKKNAILLANAPISATLRPCEKESVNFETTQNLYIEGDNLDVLKCLKETYLGKVKIIYIDPPYNTGNDFVYNDNYSQSIDEYRANSGQYDEIGNRLVANTENSGRFHTDWLNMMYPRLKVARDLLSDDGVIFISIDDNEESNLKKMCDEIFGEHNFVASAVWRSSDNSNNDAKQFSNDHNLTLIFSKRPNWQPARIFDDSKRKHYKNPDNDPNGPWFDGNPLNSPNYRENLIYDIIAPNGNIIKAPANGWRWSKETLKQKMNSGEIYFNESQTNIKRKTYLKDLGGLPPSSLWIDLDKTGHNRQAKYELLDLMPENVFDTPKPLKLIKFIINLVNDNKESIIMDFFSGSGTTGEAVMQLNASDGGNRKFILVQLPENLDEKLNKASNDKKMVIKNAISLCEKLKNKHELTVVSKERLRRAGKKIIDDQMANQGDLYDVEKNRIDIGFRVLKLDSSNMEDVYYSPAEVNQEQLNLFADNVKPGRNSEDLLFQSMLEPGATLDSKIEKTVVNGKEVYNVADGYLVACFDTEVSDDVVKAIAKMQPQYAVLRDSSLKDDSTATNFEQIFKTFSPTTTCKIL